MITADKCVITTELITTNKHRKSVLFLLIGRNSMDEVPCSLTLLERIPLLSLTTRTAYVLLSCVGAAATRACPVALSPAVLDRVASAEMKRSPAVLPKKAMVELTLGMLPSRLTPVKSTP